jgi:multidrug efflux pump subunit AcrA (membrane-fusion protein)
MQSPLAEPGTESTTTVTDQLPEPQPNSRGSWWRSRPWLVAMVALVAAALTTLLWLNGRNRLPTRVAPSASSHNSAETGGMLRLKGTTQAVRTHSIQAPLLAGEKEGTLTITNMRAAGSTIKKGDLLVEFDRQAQVRDFLDKQAENNKLSDDVLQEEAKENAARAKDETEIKTAEGDLGKAELEIQKIELLSRIDAEKARENLEEAKATLDQLRQTFSLKRKAAQASIRILESNGIAPAKPCCTHRRMPP